MTPRPRRLGGVLLSASLCGAPIGCESALPSAPSPPPVEPFLQRPFSGQFPVTNFFDHDLPLVWEDDNGAVLTWWGEAVQAQDGHQGYDWSMPQGTPLLASASGFVTRAGVAPEQYCPPLGRSVSNVAVVVLHETPRGERFALLYSHLSDPTVTVGDLVTPGEVIGYSGTTGCSTGPHLHFQVERQGTADAPTLPGALPASGLRGVPVDPYGWRGSGSDPWAGHPSGAVSQNLWMEGQAPEVGPGAAQGTADEAWSTWNRTLPVGEAVHSP